MQAQPVADVRIENTCQQGTLSWLGRDWIAASFLFLATALVVLWQSSRLGFLWDLSNVLENSYRISLGDLPYRDFPFPYAPLTFLTQAALIKLTGRVFLHHVIYSTIVGGLATVLAWRVLLNLLSGSIVSARAVAFLFSIPLIFLGIYCVYPYPFYDPDCTFTVLIGLLLLQQAERRGFPPVRAFLAGIVLVVPTFVKQNTGLAFLVCVGLGLVFLIGHAAWRNRPVAGLVWTLAGIIAGLGLALCIIHITFGLVNYEHWTVQFVASRRLPSIAIMAGMYARKSLLPWLASFAIGVVLARFNQRDDWRLAALSVFYVSLPFTFSAVYLCVINNPPAKVSALLSVWPFVLTLSVLLAVLRVRHRTGLALALPFILFGTVNGAMLAGGYSGSTYAIWPLLMILLADIIAAFVKLIGRQTFKTIVPLAIVLSSSLLISGGWYVWSNARLSYVVDPSQGKLVRSTLPALYGLPVRGPWNRDFDELLQFSDREIPLGDGILLVPGGDPFYYVTGRHPRFPVLLFDETDNPYSQEEILRLSRERDIRWLIVKHNLQLNDPELFEQLVHLVKFLGQDFRKVVSLRGYDVYRR